MSDQNQRGTRFDPDVGYVRPLASDESPCDAIVQAVAEATDRAPEALPETLYSATSPHALEQLFGNRTNRREQMAAVTFSFCGCLVTLSDDGTVVVRDESDSE